MAFIAVVGVALGATAGTAAAMVAGGIAVGAVAGGLVSAISGGNILKGTLTGAAVGGLASWGLSAAGVGVPSTTSKVANTVAPTFTKTANLSTLTPEAQAFAATPSTAMAGGATTIPGVAPPVVTTSPGLLNGLTTTDKILLGQGASAMVGQIGGAVAENAAAKEQARIADEAAATKGVNAGVPVATVRQPMSTRETYKIATAEATPKPIITQQQQATQQAAPSLLRA